MRWVVLLAGFVLAGFFERGTLPFYAIAGGALYIFLSLGTTDAAPNAATKRAGTKRAGPEDGEPQSVASEPAKTPEAPVQSDGADAPAGGQQDCHDRGSQADLKLAPPEPDLTSSGPIEPPEKTEAPVDRQEQARVRNLTIAIIGVLSCITAAGVLILWFEGPNGYGSDSRSAQLGVRTLVPVSRATSDCINDHFSLATGRPEILGEVLALGGWQRGQFTAALFCSYEWDLDALRYANGIFEEHGLLGTQWNRKVLEEVRAMLEARGLPALTDPHMGMPTPTGVELSRFLETAALALHPGQLDPPFPSLSAREAALENIDLDVNLIVPQEKPRKINVRSRPRVDLVTDAPDSITIRDLVVQYSLMGGDTFAIYNDRMESVVGRDLPSVMLAPDMFTGVLILNIRLMIELGGQGTVENLPDLTVVYLKKPVSDILGEEVDRAAVYLPQEELIVAERTQEVDYGIDETAAGEVVNGLFSSPLFHEIAHYLSAGTSHSDSAFVSEGQATFAGESMHRSLRAARLYYRESGGGVVGEMASAPLEEIASLAEAWRREVPLSDLERSLVCRARDVMSRSGFSLSSFLTIDTWRLSDLSEEYHRSFYAVAWAVYGALAESGRWNRELVPIALSALNGALNLEEEGAIAAIVEETMGWLSRAGDGVACR